MPWAVASQELYCSDSQAERFLNEAVKGDLFTFGWVAYEA